MKVESEPDWNGAQYGPDQCDDDIRHETLPPYSILSFTTGWCIGRLKLAASFEDFCPGNRRLPRRVGKGALALETAPAQFSRKECGGPLNDVAFRLRIGGNALALAAGIVEAVRRTVVDMNSDIAFCVPQQRPADPR